MESNQPSNPGPSSILHLGIGFIVGAIFVGFGWLATRVSPSSANVVRDVSISYMYETDPGSASGSNAEPVDSIQFHPGYVVVTGPGGRSRLFAVDRLRKFHFEPNGAD